MMQNLSGGSHGSSYACHSSLYFFSFLEILTPNGLQTCKILLKKANKRICNYKENKRRRTITVCQYWYQGSREFFQVSTFSCASFAEIAPFGRAIFAANISNGINVGYFHSLPQRERYNLRYRKKYVTARQRSLKVLHNQ